MFKVCFILITSSLILVFGCKKNPVEPNLPTELKVISVVPLEGEAGTEVTITGQGFDATESLNKITFNGIEAHVDSASATVLHTTVPEEATSGILAVHVGEETAEGPDFKVFTTGAVEVIIVTGGIDLDRDGNVVHIESNKSLGASLNDTLLFEEVEKGTRLLELEDLDNACSVTDTNPQYISVTVRDTTQATFEVNCENVVLRDIIVFERGSALFQMNPDGSGIAKITDSNMDQAPAISPDGKWIATYGWDPTVDEADPNGEIYLIDASGYPVTPITDSVRPTNHSFPSWSPDGEKLLFTLQGDQESSWNDIAVINRDGTGKSNLTLSESNDSRANWSPDGTRIVFSSDRNNGMSSIFVMDSEGSNIVQLTDDTNYEDYPMWSPDGSQILYISILDAGAEEIFVMDADGSNKMKLTDDATSKRFPSWSPEGTRILFSRRINEQWDIFMMNSDGSGITNLTNTPEVHESSAAWSPVN